MVGCGSWCWFLGWLDPEEGAVRRLAILGVLISVCLMSLSPCLLLAADSIDASAEHSVTRVTTADVARSGRTYEILWDLTHGPYGSNTPTGNFSNMVDTLAVHGHASSTTAAGVHNIDLSPYDVLVVGVLLAWDSVYTTAEVTAIESFVTGGGGLFLMGENSGCPNVNVNPVSQAFGTTCGVGDPYDPYTFAAHDIFNGVAAMSFASGGGLTVVPPTSEMTWDYYDDTLISLVGDCDVIVVGDGNFCTNTYLANDDNKTFVLNAFHCLSGADTPVESSSWGVIKTLYR